MRHINRTSPVLPYGGQDRQTAQRAATFRRTHRVGQVLHGKVLRWVRGGMAWVHVGGHELLAELQARPEQGVPLRFLVVQLVPEIILREVAEEDAANARAMLVPQVVVREYLAARDALDGMLHERLWPDVAVSAGPSKGDGRAVLRAFAEFMEQDAPALTGYTAVQRALFGVNHLLQSAAVGRLWYLPWCMPRARGIELLVHATGRDAARYTLGANLPVLGHTLVQCLAATERMAYRLFLERDSHAELVERVCSPDEVVPASSVSTNCLNAGTQLACLGAGGLPEGMYDVLSSVLSRLVSGGPGGSGLNRQA